MEQPIKLVGIVTLFGTDWYGSKDSAAQSFYTTKEIRDVELAKTNRVCDEMPEHDFPRRRAIEITAVLTEDGRYFHLKEIIPIMVV